ncbi:pyridoxal-phosphate dependent enzyme [Haloferula sp. A504]|uniref:pyridoxal-phosphate dependent enzyme n=1 Tax=Haloferula sp. A504 TaxID=3373601 RepID=UPI0031C3BAE4|nr:pyridoxal-phosphate dependent enzyme [Verrucomicrobiaceae bacterium E54]
MERDDRLPLDRRLRQEILLARERVYHFARPTPLERIDLPGLEIWVKREDLSPIKAYKWRGACNRMAVLSPDERQRGVITASAGNHAQGVALAAAKLGIDARIYMPRPTPRVKQEAVMKHGGDRVGIVLAGDSYDESVAAARADEADSGAIYIPAYDDLHVMAGQGTLADEVVLSGHGPFDVAYLQIGGGGMAAGAGEWLRTYWPEIELVGVEGEGQASMKAALEHGEPVPLTELDIFCDGTAVRQAGSLSFEACRGLLDRIETVSNQEVIGAVRTLWEGLRCVAEPSGAMGLAAALKNRDQLAGKRVLVILCGANVDFLQLGHMAASEGASKARTRTLRVRIPEHAGTMLDLLDRGFSGLTITDFQYGKVDAADAWPVFSLSADEPAKLDAVESTLNAAGFEWSDVAGAADIQFRAIPLRSDLLAHPLFLRLDFYERSGALRDFLDQRVRDRANLCYFNYRQSGERIGRALIGLDFPGASSRDRFTEELPVTGDGYRRCAPLDPAATARLIGQPGN